MQGTRLWSAVLAVWLATGCGVSEVAEQVDLTEFLEEGAVQDEGGAETQWKQDERQVYEEFFGNGAGSEWSIPRTSRSPKGGRSFLGPFSQEEVTLQLGGLPTHDEVEVTLELFILKSWDGNSSCCGPDRWVASVDGGRVLLDTTFSNHPGIAQAYPGPYPGGSYPGLTGR
jgi:hypothetical protein